MKHGLYEKTTKRLARVGIKDPTNVIITLAQEIEHYRAKIQSLEQCLPKQKAAGCEYCAGEKTLYQHTNNTKLYINTFGQARTIETECTPCPPYAKCSMRDIPARSAFIINYCPHCGRNLTQEVAGNEKCI